MMYMMHRNPSLSTDGYKISHKFQYPQGTQYVTSNWVCRSSRLPTNDVIFFGLQYYIRKYLLEEWEFGFFGNLTAVEEYEEVIKAYLGPTCGDVDHTRKLHKLGYLPIEIRAIEEGTKVPIKTPLYTIRNTLPEFYWLPNFLETQMSAMIWGMINSATVANLFRTNFKWYADATGASKEFVAWQGHDFSFRGMFGVEAAIMSAMAHLTSFCGTDTVPAINEIRTYYGIKGLKGPLAGSVPGTEHAVMCAGTAVEGELETFKRLITQTYPTGIVSIVSDSFDFWKVISDFLPRLKQEILNRDGKVVIRPDSGDPVKILIGDPQSSDPFVKKGLIECLWDIFGGTVNAVGYKELSPKIGAIYGDSINLVRQMDILDGLQKKGFASSNIVLGIGSYTYQHNTRDTLGSAIKATHCTVNCQDYNIYKAPKTDDGTKNSIKGLPFVYRENGVIKFTDQVTNDMFESPQNLLKVVFRNGRDMCTTEFQQIRDNVANS